MIAPRRPDARLARRPLRSRQRGLSMLSVMAIIGVALFLGTFAVKVGPAYFEKMTIDKIVSDKMEDDALKSGPRSKIYAALNRAYDMNNLRGLKAEDTITLKKAKDGGYTMSVSYEKRATLFANIDVVTRFDDAATE